MLFRTCSLESFHRLILVEPSANDFLSLQSNSVYFVYRVPKSSRGFRVITEPAPPLKAALSFLKTHLDSLPVHDCAHGFVSGRSTKTNAYAHRSQPYVLNVDLKDFFPSIKKEPMMDILRSSSLAPHLLPWVEELCFYRGSLPQGAPTSPVLSNVYMNSLDSLLVDFCHDKGWRYTRYADDLTFSGPSSLKEDSAAFLTALSSMLASYGLRINHRKVRLIGYSQCQRVTGIVVNNDKLTIRGRDREALFQSLRGRLFSTLSSPELGYLEYVRSIDPTFYAKLLRHMDFSDV